MSDTLILACETSCDETSVAIVRNGHEILANLIASQVDIHQRYGGVVPEVASRQHVLEINPLIQQAFEQAGVRPQDLTAVAATHGPGLMGALLVGLVSAKSLAWGLGKPFVGIHHLEAHIWANVVADRTLTVPFLCLLVSGGHTSLVRVNGPQDFRLLGETLDDAVGEAYDKVARLLGLPYPGGPELDRLAKDGNPKAFAFPRAMLKEEGYQFSLSGLKTSVRRTIEKYHLAQEPLPVADIAASFQAAIVEVLVAKTAAAAEAEGLGTVALAGGVAANSGLRSALQSLCAQRGWRLSLPPMGLCTDNAAMIAGLAHDLYLAGVRTPLEEEARSRMPMATAT